VRAGSREGSGGLLYDKVSALCREKGIRISELEKECGLRNSTVRKWKESIPRADRLKKVADYFGKPMEYFLK